MSEDELHTCSSCGLLVPIDLLDGKDDGSGDFMILECKACYGPDWLPMSREPFRHRLWMWWVRAARELRAVIVPIGASVLVVAAAAVLGLLCGAAP